MNKNNKMNNSPYSRFKTIMDKAAGNSTADYDGHGRFWNTLGLQELQMVSIYGVRMIAPINNTDTANTEHTKSSVSDCCHPRETKVETEKASCCHSSDTKKVLPEGSELGQSKPLPYPGRGKRSGLIKGLKGEFPFDGTQFPRLPFEGSNVSDEDILFIQDWIDAGCPEEENAFEALQSLSIDPLTNGQRAHIAVANVNTYKYESGELLQRKNAAYLSQDEIEKLREAVGETMKLNKFPLDTRSFNAYGKIHGDSCQHGWEEFLPWHRAYLYEFEQQLQDFVPGVTLPYWDWTMPDYNQGLVPANRLSGVIPDLYGCWISDQALVNLTNQGFSSTIINKLKKLKNKIYYAGPECIWRAEDAVGKANWSTELQAALMTELIATNSLFHEYRYPGMYYEQNADQSYKMDKNGRPLLIGGKNPLANPYHHHYPRAEDIEEILGITTWAQFGGGHFANQSFGMLSQNPHNTIHIWSGGENPFANPLQPNSETNIIYGDMYNDLVAFFDPIAYGHHANVDRIWAEWQRRHPNLNPDDLSAVMIPWKYSVQQLLDVSKLGYEYVMGSTLFQTNSGSPLTILKTKPSQLNSRIFEDHSRAEVRLHKVRRPVDSHFIRVFLNTPDANESTPTRDNDNFVGYIGRFGHGECIGGEGHCDIPSLFKRNYDHRPRHHNTPTNHVLDATKSIQKLRAKGAKDFEVNVVVLKSDGQLAEGSSRLVMDAVSLNFMD